METQRTARHRIALPIAWIASLALVACVGNSGDGNQNTNNADAGHHLPDGWVGLDGEAPADADVNNNWTPPTNSRVYVNTKDTLYYVDPGVSQDMVVIGDFSGPCTTGSGFYDIAVDDQKQMLGISAEALYQVDTDTAECTQVFSFPVDSPHFFSLSYVKGVDPADPFQDTLVAASAEDGEWVKINWPADLIQDIFIHLGWYDSPQYRYRSSGDIVSVQVGAGEYVTYATLKCENYTDPGCESDYLAEIDPENGDARIIGLTGYQKIFGLGFWGDRVYGFTGDGQYIVIDPTTGAGTLVNEFTGRSFWGAGNTTIPYVVQ